MSAYATYLQSGHWKTLKAQGLAKYGLTCWRCGRKIQLAQVEWHHLRYARNLYDLTVDDIRPVHADCHEKLKKASGSRNAELSVE